ncbi:MAG: AAA family ATPase [Eubacteriales bacterium]
MEIRELILKNFGKFSNRSFQLLSGINIVYGENEFGKSTIHSFIKGMLFGIERGRGRAAKKDTFSVYEPWEQSNYYAGALRFQCENRNFILNRTFDKQSKKATLVCENDGEVLSIPQGDLDMLLGKTTGMNYDNTVSIAQRKAETTDELAQELKNFAANYHSQGDSDIHIEAVQLYLKNKKREIEDRRKTERMNLDTKREKLSLERDYVQREIERLNSLVKENRKLEQINNTKQEKKEAKLQISPIEYLAILALILIAFYFLPRPWNVLLCVIIVLAFGLYVWNKLKHKPMGRNIKKELLKESEKIIWEKTRLQSELQEKAVVLDNIQEQLEELTYISTGERDIRDKIESLEMAMQRVGQVSGDIQKDFGRELNENASKILSEITEGKYNKLIIGENLEVSLLYNGRNIMLEQVSRGTVEQVYFAIRMAITSLLHGEQLPILLDDTFAYYDDRRLEQVLKWLSNLDRQVVIFTCHRREIDILGRAALPYHIVE